MSEHEKTPVRADARRITLVANEMRGCSPCGGLGTSTTNLALALAGLGHQVEILYFGPSAARPTSGWQRLYDDGGVRIRMLPRSGEKVDPPWFADCRDVELALREDPPDVVITQDGAAPSYTAMRLRQLGLDFERTSFVVVCHGTRGWIKDVSRNVRVFPHLLHLATLERASIELADAVVSPSAYFLSWIRAQGWRTPERTVVIPHPIEVGAVGRVATTTSSANGSGRVERLAFFGRLDERKGVRPLAAAVNAIEPELLGTVEFDFVGAEVPMKADEVEALLTERTKRALRGVTFATDLDQQEALERLTRRGTVAVMPSLEDNSPNTVYECLALGIPFIASDRGGTAELVAPEDRARVLFEPSSTGIEAALRRALDGGEALRPARATFDEAETLRAWSELLAEPPRAPAPAPGLDEPVIDVVVCLGSARADSSPCIRALARQRYQAFRVIVAGSPGETSIDGLDAVAASSDSIEAQRHAGLNAASAPWVVFLNGDDHPHPDLLRTLVRAQAASGADVVSCGLIVEAEGSGPAIRLFSGGPGGLAVLGNDYGGPALLRRTTVSELAATWPVEDDPDWALLAALSTSGAEVVSIPSPLVTRSAQPGSLDRSSSDALLVVDRLERVLPPPARSLARLAAGLAAASPGPASPPGLVHRAATVAREEGILALLRRSARRSGRAFRRTSV